MTDASPSVSPDPGAPGPTAGIALILLSHGVAAIGIGLQSDPFLVGSHLPYLAGVGWLVWLERRRERLWGGLWVVVAVLGLLGMLAVLAAGRTIDQRTAVLAGMNAIPAWSVLASIADQQGEALSAGMLRWGRVVMAVLIVVVAVATRGGLEQDLVNTISGVASIVWFALFLGAEGVMIRLVSARTRAASP